MKYVIIALIAIICIFILITLLSLLIAIINKNHKPKTLKLIENDRDNDYAEEVLSLIRINTEIEEGKTLFFKKLKTLFPRVFKCFKLENIGSNICLTYDAKENVSHILIVTHMDNLSYDEKAYEDNGEIYGKGTFDSKAYLYVTFKAIEESLELKGSLNTNLVIAVIDRDETKEYNGNNQIVNEFLRRGKFFTLVLKEGTGIIDPSFLGLQSTHALIGVGATGEMTINFHIPKTKDKKILEKFALETKDIFKTEIDQYNKRVLKAFGKDMDFMNRLIYLNPYIFKRHIKNELENNAIEIGKLLKTHVNFEEIIETGNKYILKAKYNLASHDIPAEIIRILIPYLNKYKIDYRVEKIIDPSKFALTTSRGYRIVKKAIIDVFKNVYIVPYIVTKITNRHYFSKVSDCVIRFSPLYYTHKAIKDAYNGNEHIMKRSLSYGVDFFKKIIDREEKNVLS